jgi:hypothetical protein
VSERSAEYSISGLGSASSLTVLLNIGDEIFPSVVISIWAYIEFVVIDVKINPNTANKVQQEIKIRSDEGKV